MTDTTNKGYQLERYNDTNEPLFVDTTEEGKPHEGEPFVERDAIMAIVKDPATGKYLGLRWKTIDWKTLITGGVEEGQTAETAAREEIQQETGYGNLRLIRTLTNVHSKFFHGPKKQNRFAHFTVFYFELENQEHEELSDTEKAIHNVVWLTSEEMDSFGLPPAHQYSWDELKGL